MTKLAQTTTRVPAPPTEGAPPPATMPWRVLPRHRIDLWIIDVIRLFLAQFAIGRLRMQRKAERAWSGDNALATLSVRTAFDALLQSLELPAGSEICMSALTIPDMPRIVRAHGLVPVAVDVDLDTLLPTADALEAAITDKTRMAVIVHLFGGRSSLAPLRAVCDRHGVMLVEDGAQGLAGRDVWRDESADVTFVSFGPIKTATALGGAITHVADPALLARMRDLVSAYPLQLRRTYALRSLRYGILGLLARPTMYGLMWKHHARKGIDTDEYVSGIARSFGSLSTEELLERLRLQPCAPLSRMMLTRKRWFPRKRLAWRAGRGEQLAAALPRHVLIGREQEIRTHWLFVILHDEPDVLVMRLRARGIDATWSSTTNAHASTTSIDVVEDSLDAPNARAIANSAVFVPIAPTNYWHRAIVNVYDQP